ncbi:hypothetical protein A3G65_01910 [Candidatus Roizmanbacteria bacterium RIFCSPLOWO2_12_FULL_37_7b]|nr:MAG: hypothetical protein A3G65_01910 [Candidatus Roizmanbacteria bacterium RIFCSPLOWO2_12_FULL_37_7b]
MDATIPEDSAGRLPREEGALRPLDEGLAKVRQILEKTLGPERAGELIPSEKAVEGITQENFQWANRYVEGPNDTNPNDGEIYSVRFKDGSASFFTHSKVPVNDPWRAILLNAAAVGAGVKVHEWATNNSGTWDGKNRLELVIPVADPTADGPVVDRYTAVFDGIKTDFTTAKANVETVTQEFDGDQSQPELMLGQWRELIRKDGRALEAIEYSAAPVASPVPTTTTA